MNINIVLDSEYICKELKKIDGAIRIANLFMFMKHKSNIIILQDKKQEIIRDILQQLALNFEKIENNELDDAKIFLLELAKGTNQYDFITDEEANALETLFTSPQVYMQRLADGDAITGFGILTDTDSFD